jgi:hypothetical protein
MVQHTDIEVGSPDAVVGEDLLGAQNVHQAHRGLDCYCEDPLSFFPRALKKLYSLWISGTYPFASKGRKLDFHYMSQLDRRRAGRIRLGN